MKIVFILMLAVVMKVSFAVPPSSNNSPNVISSPQPSYSQRRYQLFDLLSSKRIDDFATELIEKTANVREILRDYKEWLMEDNKEKSKLYQDLKEKLENFIENLENFKKDRTNCELQRQVQTEFLAMEYILTEIDNEAIDQIWEKKRELKDEKNNNDDNGDDFLKLTKEIENFLKTLNNAERELDKELIKWCQEFLITLESQKKAESFKSIQDLFDEELERELKNGQANCKLVALFEWRQTLSKMLLQLLIKQRGKLADSKDLQEILDKATEKGEINMYKKLQLVLEEMAKDQQEIEETKL